MAEFLWIDGKKGPKLSFGPDYFEIHEKVKKRVPFKEVESIEVIDKEILDKKASSGLGLVGLLVGGPIGAAVGVGLGTLTAPVAFIVTTNNGSKYVGNAGKLLFNAWHKKWKVFEASSS